MNKKEQVPMIGSTLEETMAKVKEDALAIRLGGSATLYISPKTVLGLLCGHFHSLNLVEFCMRKLTVHGAIYLSVDD